MMEIDNKQKFGLKLTVISQADYEDYKEACEALINLGYKAIVIDNGNTVFQKFKGAE